MYRLKDAVKKVQSGNRC